MKGGGADRTMEHAHISSALLSVITLEAELQMANFELRAACQTTAAVFASSVVEPQVFLQQRMAKNLPRPLQIFIETAVTGGIHVLRDRLDKLFSPFLHMF